MIRVSAIVSTYNSAAFFKGRMDDLLGQSLYQRGELEIIVVNAGSKQDEAYYIRDFLRQGARLTVITSLREPLYASWNRAIRIAQGAYLTSANTDDRLCPDAYAILASALDKTPGVALVYGDSYVTTTPNATWNGDYELSHDPPYAAGRFNWPDYDPATLLHFCYMGPHPMWRSAVHDAIGLFDESYMVAGDYEMWLRMAANGYRMQRLDEALGLFYWGDGRQLGRAHAGQSGMESRRALLKHRRAIEASNGNGRLQNNNS